MNDDDQYEPGTRIVRDKGYVRVSVLTMDANSLDALMNRELKDARMIDNAAHRPGYRVTSGRVDPLRAAARDSINDAHVQAWQTSVTSWRDRSPEQVLAEARSSAEESNAMSGREDPRTAKSKKYRKKQSARPFERPEAPDEDDNYEATPGADEPDDGEDNDDDGVEAILRASSTHTESAVRRDSLDVLRERHAKVLDAAYRRYDAELLQNARRGDDE